jgi:hypothetical protein
MKKFIIAIHMSNPEHAKKPYAILSVDLSKEEYLTPVSAASSAEQARHGGHFMAVEENCPFIQLTDFDNGESLNIANLALIADFHEKSFDQKADCVFRIQYKALLDSLVEPNGYYLACGSCGRWGEGDINQAYGDEYVQKIDNEADGKQAIRAYIENQDLGGSTFLGGEVFQNGYLVGVYGYNGRLFDGVSYGGLNSSPIEEFLQS